MPFSAVKGAVAFALAALLPLFLVGCGSGGGNKPAPGDTPDQVTSLPDYGAPKTRQLAGYVNATADGNNKLFYYFAEAQVGQSEDVPLLIWLNGGPGASSLMGFFAENMGPQKINNDGSISDNPDTITKKYHLMAVDNPVGAGFSYTSNGNFAKSEADVRTQFAYALGEFFKLHSEYKSNPLWVVGESYAGVYVPNIAYELARNHSEDINLQGIIVGNGLYNISAQYATVGDFAYGNGVIDEKLLKQMHTRETACLAKIASQVPEAGPFCENTTVKWLYSADVAGDIMYYDIGLVDYSFDTVTAFMSKYLNREDTRAALHVGDHEWVMHDEDGPVAEHLSTDWLSPSILVVGKLLDAAKYKVVLYNGVRDGSVCNHMGNLNSLLNMQWSGASAWVQTRSVPWPSKKKVEGYMRSSGNLYYATFLRTGHFVPTVVPDAFATFLDNILAKPAAVQRTEEALV